MNTYDRVFLGLVIAFAVGITISFSYEIGKQSAKREALRANAAHYELPSSDSSDIQFVWGPKPVAR